VRFGSIAFGGARRGYILTAGEGHITSGRTAATVTSQASGSTLVTAGDLGVHSGIGVTSGADRTVVQHAAGFVTGYEAGRGAGGVFLTDVNAGSNVLSSSTQTAGVNRGNVKHSGTSAQGGEFSGQIANSYITAGRSSESFGNSGSYNEGRYTSSYASLPDSYVSGGRIEDSGGFVLGEYVGVHGTATGSGGAAYASGEEAAGLSTGSRNAAFIGSRGSARALYSSSAAHGNEGAFSSGSDLTSVPAQTVVNIPDAPSLPVSILRKPAIAQIPVVHPTVIPLTAHQQRVVTIPQTPIVKSSVEVPVVQPTVVPVAQATPVTAYQQTLVETPQASFIPVTTIRRPAVAKISAIQPQVVPVAQTVPVTAYQQTVVGTPQAPVIPVTTIRRPAVVKVPVIHSAVAHVAEAVPVTPYQERVAAAAAAVPVAPVVPLVDNTAHVITHDRRPTLSQTQIVGAAPLTTYFQETPVVSTITTRNKLRPVPHLVETIPVSRPVVPIANTYLSTPAPTLLPIQTEFSAAGGSGFAIGRDAGDGRPFQGRPAISVATNGAVGISVPSISPDVETFGAVPVTEGPVLSKGDSSGGNSFSTTATTVFTSGSAPLSSVQSHVSSGNVYSPPAPAILASNSITSALRSGISNGGFLYSTPASAVLTGEAISVTPVPTVTSRVSSGSFSLSTHLPAEKSIALSSEYSQASPASTVVSSGTVSVNAFPLVKPNVGTHSVPSVTIVSGDNVPVINTRVTPAVGYSYPKPSVSFVTGKAETSGGVSLASGLEPALFESTQRLASGLEIPSSTAGPTFDGSDIARERYSTRAGATRLTVLPTSSAEITNIHGNGYDVPEISRDYALNHKALLSSTVEPVHSVSVIDGDFGARKYYQRGEFVASYSAGESRERFTPQINLTYGAPPVTVYTGDSGFISDISRARGRARPYLSPVSGYVSSTPVPVTPASGPRIVYSDTARPNFVSSTSSPVVYTAQIIPRSQVVSTPAPAVTSTLVYPAVPSVLQSTSSDHHNPEGFGLRVGQSASRRKPTPTTGTNYDNENVEALLDKYSGKFGGLLDNNKEGFISGVITGDLVDRGVGAVVEDGRGEGSHRGRVDSLGLSGFKGVHSATGYSDKSFSTVSGTRDGFSTTPETDISSGTRTLGNVEYISTTASPSTGGSRAKFRYGLKVNTDAAGGVGHDAIAAGRQDSKLRSKQAPAVFITRLSDINPLLIAKLGAQCTCKSNTVTLKRPDEFSNDGISGNKVAPISSEIFDDDVTSRSGTYNIPEHIPLAPLPGSNLVTGSSPDIILGLNEGIPSSSESLTPVPLATPRTTEFLKGIGLDEIRVTPAPTVLVTTLRPRTRLRAGSQIGSTPPAPIGEVSSATGIRYHARPQAPIVISTTAVPVAVPRVPDPGRVRAFSGGYPETGFLGSGADVVGSTRGSGIRTDGSVLTVESGAAARAGIGAGRAFDRYGPGGWRGLDETLQGSVDCQRAGLFRHPKYCNKFYACYWDEWKGRYTLHVFNCPVHLAYDSNLGACNWPSKGPSCSGDNLLV
jgi:hypothetical protein